jgi:hypothetical protein
MASFGRKRYWRSAARRAFTSVALVSFLLSTVGLPLPALTTKDPSEPFPCQNHPCGCRSAEECWRHCCCFTAAERWAWARANHVEPPSYAERPASEAAGPTPCCAHHEHPMTDAEPKAASCCTTAGIPPSPLGGEGMGVSPAWPFVEKLSYCDSTSSSLPPIPPDPPPRSAS